MGGGGCLGKGLSGVGLSCGRFVAGRVGLSVYHLNSQCFGSGSGSLSTINHFALRTPILKPGSCSRTSS